MQIINTSRTLMLGVSLVLAVPAWAGAGLTSAGVDPNVNNNAAQNEPTLAQVAPVQNGASGATGTVSAPAANSPGGAVPNIAGAAGSNPANPNDPHATGGTAVAAPPAPPAPPPPPPDPSTLPVSVIRPVNKPAAAETTAPGQNPPGTETAGASASNEKSARRASAPTSSTPPPSPTNTPAPTPASPPRNLPTGNARTEGAQLTGEKSVPAAAVTTPGATADGSANGYVFYMGSAIAGIILALAFASFLRGGGGDGKPGA